MMIVLLLLLSLWKLAVIDALDLDSVALSTTLLHLNTNGTVYSSAKASSSSSLSLTPTPPTASTTGVTYTQRSFIINGKPTLLLSGSIHYTRIPPSDWESIFQLAKVPTCISVHN